MRGCLIRSTLFLVVLIAFLALVAFVLYQSAQFEPDFYRAALEINEKEQQLAGSEFETRMLQLQNDLQVEGNWEAVFTDKQINGWLANDLPKKFPNSLPRNVYDPRVAIEPGKINLAFRYESKKFSGIVVVRGNVFCTEVSNQLAVRIDEVKAGLVNLPISKWLDEISKGIARSGFSMVWTEQDGNPVALITLPNDTIAGGDVIIESIELMDGKVRLRGKTTDPAHNSMTLDDLATRNRPR